MPSLKLFKPGGGQQPPTKSAPSPVQTPTMAGGPRVKLKHTKRPAEGDLVPPTAKRVASISEPSRKLSLKVKPANVPSTVQTPISRVKLLPGRKQSRITSITTHNVRREIPKRETGVGYDSEDSEREDDPAIQQGLILRMPPGRDAEILHAAIAENRVGARHEEGGVDVSVKFVTPDLRRAIVRVEDRKYAAALVDLPCIVEAMKSWDKKGWWKVSDVCQMLLVLGRVNDEKDAKSFELPKEVDKETMQYAHGLTPPMHYVRKRRFRKRINPKQIESVDAEVERLLKEDEEWERRGGKVKWHEHTQSEWDMMRREAQEQYDDAMDADGEVLDSTEYFQEMAESPEEDYSALEADLNNALAEDAAEAQTPATELVTESPLPVADQAAPFAAIEHATAEESAVETPAGNGQDEPSSDEDESDEDDDDLDVVDEDAAVRAAERAQQLEEVADLEREIDAVRNKVNSISNQLLKRREMDKLAKLEGDLKMKRTAFGLDADE